MVKMIPKSYKFYVILFRKPPYESYTYGLDCVPSSWIRLRDVNSQRVGIGYPGEGPQFSAMWVKWEIPYTKNWLVYDADVISGTDNYDEAIIRTNMSINLLIKQNAIDQQYDNADSMTPEKKLSKQTEQENLVATDPQKNHSNVQKQICRTAENTHTKELCKVQTETVEYAISANNVMKPTEKLTNKYEPLKKSSNVLPRHANSEMHKDKSSLESIIKDTDIRSSKQHEPASKHNGTQHINESAKGGVSETTTWADIQGRLISLGIEIDQQISLFNQTTFQFMAVNRFNRELLKLLNCFNENQKHCDVVTLGGSSLSQEYKNVVMTNLDRVKFKFNYNVVQFIKMGTNFFADVSNLIENDKNEDILIAEIKMNCEEISSKNNLMHHEKVVNHVNHLELFDFSDDNDRLTGYIHRLITKQSSVLSENHVELLRKSLNQERLNASFLVQFQKDLEDLCEVNDKVIYQLNCMNCNLIKLMSNCHLMIQLVSKCQQTFPDNSSSPRSSILAKERKNILKQIINYSIQLSDKKNLFSKELLMYLKRTLNTFKNIPNPHKVPMV